MASLSSANNANVPRLDGLGLNTIYGDLTTSGDITADGDINGDTITGSVLVTAPTVTGTSVGADNITCTGDITMSGYSSNKVYPQYRVTPVNITGATTVITIPTWTKDFTVVGTNIGWSVGNSNPYLRVGQASGTNPWITTLSGYLIGLSAGPTAAVDAFTSGTGTIKIDVGAVGASLTNFQIRFIRCDNGSTTQTWSISGITTVYNNAQRNTMIGGHIIGPSNQSLDTITLGNSGTVTAFTSGTLTVICN